jgi:hypothetical protein
MAPEVEEVDLTCRIWLRTHGAWDATCTSGVSGVAGATGAAVTTEDAADSAKLGAKASC